MSYIFQVQLRDCSVYINCTKTDLETLTPYEVGSVRYQDLEIPAAIRIQLGENAWEEIPLSEVPFIS